MVKPIIVYKGAKVDIEATGQKENIELAKYIADFLDYEFERLWNLKKDLKGLKAKNSFFSGLALGYERKLEESQSSLEVNEQRSLIRIYNDLDEIQRKIHKRVSKTTHSRGCDSNALASGVKAGKSLTVNPAIKSKQNKTFKLTWRQ